MRIVGEAAKGELGGQVSIAASGEVQARIALDAPSEEHLSTGDKRHPLPPPQDRPHALEPAREDVHRQLASALAFLEEEREAGREAGPDTRLAKSEERKAGMGAHPENQ